MSSSRHLRRSRKQERDTAARIGGSVNAQSGAGWQRKNDVRNAGESWELKTTTQIGYRLTHLELAKAEVNALTEHRRMVFGIEFDLGNGSSRRYVVVTEDDYLSDQDELAQLYLHVSEN